MSLGTFRAVLSTVDIKMTEIFDSGFVLAIFGDVISIMEANALVQSEGMNISIFFNVSLAWG